MASHVYFFHYYANIKVGSYDSWPIEEIFTLDDVIILIKAALNKDKNQHYYKIFRKMLVSVS